MDFFARRHLRLAWADFLFAMEKKWLKNVAGNGKINEIQWHQWLPVPESKPSRACCMMKMKWKRLDEIKMAWDGSNRPTEEIHPGFLQLLLFSSFAIVLSLLPNPWEMCVNYWKIAGSMSGVWPILCPAIPANITNIAVCEDVLPDKYLVSIYI